ncbi:MAG TPA: DUF423 domain-containing protein [Steroidobacteraceae bacterium]|nr:DUF423 domain-containing protein [Steroidobacteraceae bacterium]
MSSRSGRIIALSGLLLAAATVFGALGGHALRAQLPPDRLEVYETAVRYHFYGALGLLGIGVAARFITSRLLTWAAALVIAGMLLFSGSIYLLSFGAPRWLGMVTPFGGLALMAGWVLLAAAAWRERAASHP